MLRRLGLVVPRVAPARLLSTDVFNADRVRVRVSLADLVKDVERFQRLPREEATALWEAFHDAEDQPLASGLVWDKTAWDSTVRARAQECPLFVLPVVRGASSFFVMFSEFKDDFVLFTFLEHFRQFGPQAVPWASSRFLTDVDSALLVHNSFTPYLTKDESKFLAKTWLTFYSEDRLFEQRVRVFNQDPDRFDFSQAFPGLPTTAPQS